MIKYFSRNVDKTQTKVIAEVTQGSVDPWQSSTWKSVPMTVPNCPPSRLDYSSIIEISYEIEVNFAVYNFFKAFVLIIDDLILSSK